jgi:WD40 repeat protein
MRTHKPVKKERIHNAAINMLECSKSGVIVTGSADKTIKTFDILDLFRPLSSLNATDAVFCGEVLENLIITGCGDGNILGFNMDTN